MWFVFHSITAPLSGNSVKVFLEALMERVKHGAVVEGQNVFTGMVWVQDGLLLRVSGSVGFGRGKIPTFMTSFRFLP